MYREAAELSCILRNKLLLDASCRTLVQAAAGCKLTNSSTSALGSLPVQLTTGEEVECTRKPAGKISCLGNERPTANTPSI